MSCNKAAYTTRAEARQRQKNSKQAKRHSTQAVGKSTAMKPYLCKWCQLWHLGHRPKNQEKGFR